MTTTYGEEASVVYRSRNPNLTGIASLYTSSEDQYCIDAVANHFDSMREQSRGGKVVLREALAQIALRKAACALGASNTPNRGGWK